MKKNVLLIINPVSGGKKKSHFPQLVDKYLDRDKFNPSCVFTEYAGHARTLALEAINAGTEIIVAVGGDGTINEIASVVEGSGACMGIVPCGSGNGLALSLHTSLNSIKALKAINLMRSRTIDTGILNGKRFFNIAGIGFDAHISHEFARMTSRGFTGYIRTAFREIMRYRPAEYVIEIDGMNYKRTAFMISIANSPQYGNNAFISPKAQLDDGLLDVCIVRPFPIALFPAVALRMFTRTSEHSRYLEIIKGRNIRIVSYNNNRVHLDGEPEEMGEEICITVKPSSLRVLY